MRAAPVLVWAVLVGVVVAQPSCMISYVLYLNGSLQSAPVPVNFAVGALTLEKDATVHQLNTFPWSWNSYLANTSSIVVIGDPQGSLPSSSVPAAAVAYDITTGKQTNSFPVLEEGQLSIDDALGSIMASDASGRPFWLEGQWPEYVLVQYAQGQTQTIFTQWTHTNSSFILINNAPGLAYILQEGTYYAEEHVTAVVYESDLYTVAYNVSILGAFPVSYTDYVSAYMTDQSTGTTTFIVFDGHVITLQTADLASGGPLTTVATTTKSLYPGERLESAYNDGTQWYLIFDHPVFAAADSSTSSSDAVNMMEIVVISNDGLSMQTYQYYLGSKNASGPLGIACDSS